LYEDDDAEARHLVGGSYASGNKKVKNTKNMYVNKRKAKEKKCETTPVFRGSVVQREDISFPVRDLLGICLGSVWVLCGFCST